MQKGCNGLERQEDEELLLNGSRVSFLRDEEFWRWEVVLIAQQCECTYPQTVHLKTVKMVKFYVKMVNVSKERKGGEFRVRHLGKSPSDSFNTG